MSQHLDAQPGINIVRAARLAMGASADLPLPSSAQQDHHPQSDTSRAAHAASSDRNFVYADGTIHYPAKVGMRERNAHRDSFLRGGTQFSGFQSQRVKCVDALRVSSKSLYTDGK